MGSNRSGLTLIAVVCVALFVSSRLTSPARERSSSVQAAEAEKAGRPGARASEGTPAGRYSLQDALVRPYDFPFQQPTKLDDVARHLRETLHARVVVDRAAIARQELSEIDTAQLDLHGVRLKVGLKLLLDPLGLTFKVVPEDNLLVITDLEGSDDPLDLILAEMKSIHRDLHDVQDRLDEVRETLGLEEEGDDPAMRKPAFIEKKPSRPRRGSHVRRAGGTSGRTPSE